MGLTGSAHVGPAGGIDESTALLISNNVNHTESASSYGTMSKPELPSSRDVSGDIEENGTDRALLSPQAAPKEDSVKVSTSTWGVISVLLLGGWHFDMRQLSSDPLRVVILTSHQANSSQMQTPPSSLPRPERSRRSSLASRMQTGCRPRIRSAYVSRSLWYVLTLPVGFTQSR